MRSIQIAFVIFVFSLVMSTLNGYSFMWSNTADYSMVNALGDMPDEIETVNEAQQYASTMNIFSVIINAFTFQWVDAYIPYYLEDGFNPFVTIFQTIGTFILAVTIIELFLKHRGILE